MVGLSVVLSPRRLLGNYMTGQVAGSLTCLHRVDLHRQNLLPSSSVATVAASRKCEN